MAHESPLVRDVESHSIQKEDTERYTVIACAMQERARQSAFVVRAFDTAILPFIRIWYGIGMNTHEKR